MAYRGKYFSVLDHRHRQGGYRDLIIFLIFLLVLSLSVAATENDPALHNARKLYQYAQAERLHERALPLRETALGLEHRDVAQTLNNLANVYRDRGHYGKAEELYGRALAIREKVLEPEHSDIAQSLKNALLVQRQLC
jgi:tetratricopeptide (TPR) repeat protein